MFSFGSRNDPKQYHSTQVLTDGLIYEIDVHNVDDGINYLICSQKLLDTYRFS